MYFLNYEGFSILFFSWSIFLIFNVFLRHSQVLQDATVDQKIVKLKELLIEETTSMKTSGTAYLAIKRAMEDVELRGNQLKETLSSSLGALDILAPQRVYISFYTMAVSHSKST